MRQRIDKALQYMGRDRLAIQVAAAKAAGLDALGTIPLPEVETLGEFLNPEAGARTAAIRLGKALFWDMQVGSDGQACASCHFHAGADSRARNQLSPGLKAGDAVFGNTTLGVPGFPQFAPDYTLVETDFPFHLLQDPEENNFNNRVVLQDTNDVAALDCGYSARCRPRRLGNPAYCQRAARPDGQRSVHAPHRLGRHRGRRRNLARRAVRRFHSRPRW